MLYILNEGITMCLKINKYYTNVCQHNLFILQYGYMFRLDVSHLQAPTITLPDALYTMGSQSGQSIWYSNCRGLKMTNIYSKHVAILYNKQIVPTYICVILIDVGQILAYPDSAICFSQTHFYQPYQFHGNVKLNDNIIQDRPPN